jgi:hypothetical protein
MRKQVSPVLAVSLSWILAVGAGTTPVYGQQPLQQQPQENPPFRVSVIEGEGSINNIRQMVNRGAVVQVEDENKNPLSGVAVSFFLPNDGPSGLFPNGSRVLTVFTDDKGMAASRSVHFNNMVGLMRVRVVASLFSQTASTVITQTNISSAAAVKSAMVPATGMPKVSKPSGNGVSKKLIVVLAIAGAAAAGGAYFALHKGSPSATIGTGAAGAPTIGGPK